MVTRDVPDLRDESVPDRSSMNLKYALILAWEGLVGHDSNMLAGEFVEGV